MVYLQHEKGETMKISTQLKEIMEKLKLLESGIRVVIHNQKNIQEDTDKKLEVLLKNDKHTKTEEETI